MRSNAGSLMLLLILLPSITAAQEDSRRNLVVPLAEGGYVAFKNETAKVAVGRASGAVPELQREFRTQALVDENRVIHRVLVDGEGKYLFGYDLVIQPAPSSKTFTIAVTPLNPNFLAGSQSTRVATLPESAEPQILGDGDSFALDLLVNEKTGVKIVDFVKVSFDASNLWNTNPKGLPRDFSLDAVELRVADFRLSIDGQLVSEARHGTKFSGPLIWYYIEGQGRFIFSLVPREGYQFQKIGTVSENRIEFDLKGKHYEWRSAEPILPGGDSWSLWVLEDPDYVPFGSRQTSKQEKNRLEKLDDSIKTAQARAAKPEDAIPSTFQEKTEAPQSEITPKRFRVMAGAADRMANLWPK